eukprot:TRINITY_DN2059_c0_g2_i5.p1 TRINITY_DN2059_c0_g2~~TRINITY_DN2059_c0_g2_i5.p1  ORF type:complete len:134 (+),score=34.23 TRINITY_DN2059_c0_g2_i5:189-590(+)
MQLPLDPALFSPKPNNLLEKLAPLMDRGISIILLKLQSNDNTRIYLEYQTPREAIEATSQFYEKLLRAKNGEDAALSYSVGDFFNFLDNLAELVLLIYDETVKVFRPHGKDFIKALVLSNKSQAQKISCRLFT